MAKIYAAFCGTGKTFFCKHTIKKAVEIEYWKYKDNGLQKEYINDIKKYFDIMDYIFISTDPDGLKLLHKEGFGITLVYPQNELREEYLNRYIERDSPHDFIGPFMKYWNIWIDELKNQKYCKHIILKSGEFLSTFLNCTLNTKNAESNLNPAYQDLLHAAIFYLENFENDDPQGMTAEAIFHNFNDAVKKALKDNYS